MEWSGLCDDEGAESVKAKTFFIAALSCVLALLLGTAAAVAWIDPMLTVGGLKEGETALFVNERYEMAGLLRSQEYSNLVMGTSLVANYRASWFEEGLGEKTLKVTFPDGRLSEFDTALELAVRTHGPMHNVFFCLDPNVLVRESQDSELPEYLYNDNPVDDLQFYLNAESLALAAKSVLLGDSAKVPLDEAYVWDRDSVFSVGNALAGYPRPEPTGVTLPGDAYLPAAERNMDGGWVGGEVSGNPVRHLVPALQRAVLGPDGTAGQDGGHFECPGVCRGPPAGLRERAHPQLPQRPGHHHRPGAVHRPHPLLRRGDRL